MQRNFFTKHPNPSDIEEKIQGFPSWLEIDLDKIELNLINIRKHVGVEVMPVIKNNAYGHGLIPVAEFLEQLNVKWVMVAKLPEALRIKREGCDLGVLSMDVLFTEEQYTQVVREGITQTIYTLEAAERLSEAASKTDDLAKVFVKVDTGLNRVGVKYGEAVGLIEKIASLPSIEVSGLYSTFMQNPEIDKVMLRRFIKVCEQLEKNGLEIPYKSMASSDAIFHNPEAWLSMVRPGIGLYGIYPEKKDMESGLHLEQALKMKARLEHVKWVEENETVTYFGRFTAPERMQVGTLHLGFYDGLPRELSNKGRVFINGLYKSNIGSVSLNHYLVDLRGLEARKGDVVTVIGDEGENDLRRTAETAGWMVYSLLNHLNPFTPRVYFRKGKPVALDIL
jgi:alanine racemase